MYGQDFEFAVFVLIGWVVFLVVAAIIQGILGIRASSARSNFYFSRRY